MSLSCSVCGLNTIFYVWTSSRDFPLDKLFEKLGIRSKKIMKDYKYNGHPICFHCREQLNDDI